MSNGGINKLTIKELKEAIKNCGGIRAAGRFLKIDHSSIIERLAKEGLTYKDLMSEYQNEIAPELKNDIDIKGDCIITCDYHIPFVSLKWVNRVVEMGRISNINQLIIVGDFFDFDRLSYWIKQSNAEETAVPLGEELSLAEMVIEQLEEQYSIIHMLGGNHWRRLLRMISFTVPSSKLMGLVGRHNDPRYKVYNSFDWATIDGKIRVTHPARARKLDYTLARDLSILYPNQWLMVAHRHRVNEGFTPDGRPQWEVGWLGDVDRMRYVTYVDNTYYKWVQGFSIYKDGVVRNLTEYNYDWSEIDNREKKEANS